MAEIALLTLVGMGVPPPWLHIVIAASFLLAGAEINNNG